MDSTSFHSQIQGLGPRARQASFCVTPSRAGNQFTLDRLNTWISGFFSFNTLLSSRIPAYDTISSHQSRLTTTSEGPQSPSSKPKRSHRRTDLEDDLPRHFLRHPVQRRPASRAKVARDLVPGFGELLVGRKRRRAGLGLHLEGGVRDEEVGAVRAARDLLAVEAVAEAAHRRRVVVGDAVAAADCGEGECGAGGEGSLS